MSRGIKNHFHCSRYRFHHRLTDSSVHIADILRDYPDEFNLRIVIHDPESLNHFHYAYLMHRNPGAAFNRMFGGKPINPSRLVVCLKGIHDDDFIVTIDQSEQVKPRGPSVQERHPFREAHPGFLPVLYDEYSQPIIAPQRIADTKN